MGDSEQAQGLDSRTKEILDLLRKGMKREDIARKFHHKDRQAIDQHMRRRDHVWSEPDQTYVKSKNHPDYKQSDELFIPERVRRILLEFRSITADAREIAKRVGFKDHKEMANFMKVNGFRWSQQHHNYIRAGFRESQEQTPSHTSGATPLPRELSHVDLPLPEQMPKQFVQLFPVLHLLQENQDKLVALMEQTPLRTLTIPRFNIGGGYITKSLNLHASLVEIIKDFSRENNIPQREVIEVALVMFFYRHGYGNRVEAIMSMD